ncbi:MAG: helix-turn-helix transcriptional regulator [Gammaproteobacteria bacterium]|nr:helix-turn-helix transcriptional regulator [Gammaproteobacteria bacterium]
MELELEEMEAAADRASKLMKTLGHRDRLMILCQLAEEEKSVGEIAEQLGIRQSPLSQHLARMRNEGLVKTRRESQTIYYSLANSDVTKVIEVLYDIYCHS